MKGHPGLAFLGSYALSSYTAPTRCALLTYGMRGAPNRRVKPPTVGRCICRRVCYAVSGTDIPHGGTLLSASYAVSGTALALSGYARAMDVRRWRLCTGALHTPRPPKVNSAICLRTRCAIPGTGPAYAGLSAYAHAMSCLVLLSSRMGLQAARY
eukprot:998693-Rhodomonas_salina.1